jgi:hypothetical protein
MIPTTSTPDRQAAARRQLVRLLAERLVRDALKEPKTSFDSTHQARKTHVEENQPERP